MVLDLVYKFQMIFLRGTYVIEWKPNVGRTDVWTKLIIPDLIKMSVVDWSMTCSYKTHAPGL